MDREITIRSGDAAMHVDLDAGGRVTQFSVGDVELLAEVGDVIINYSTGAIGVPIERRLLYLRELTPDVAALNMSSMNYAKYSKRRKDFVFKAVFENSFDTIIEFLTAMRELGIKPEHECFDAGHVANLESKRAKAATAAGQPLRPVLGDLVNSPDARRLQLTPLSRSAVAALLDGAISPNDVVAGLMNREPTHELHGLVDD